MIPELHDGPRSARKKDGFIIQVVLYTYMHIICAYVGMFVGIFKRIN